PNTATLAHGATFTGTTGGLTGGGLSLDDNSKQVLLVDGGSLDLDEEWTISAWYQDLHDTAGFRTLTRSEGDGQDHQVIVNNRTSDLGMWNNGRSDVLPGGFR
ncbi:MAG: hypothetical protein GWO24_25850, partial [Akkermansiaceae bacterium]|nr:hypothetical protein [Akkermansiaceae bacterium]